MFFILTIIPIIGIWNVNFVILSHFQWFAGFVTYLFPGLDACVKKAYMPVHVTFGILTFILVCAACLTGITEKLVLTFE